MSTTLRNTRIPVNAPTADNAEFMARDQLTKSGYTFDSVTVEGPEPTTRPFEKVALEAINTGKPLFTFIVIVDGIRKADKA